MMILRIVASQLWIFDSSYRDADKTTIRSDKIFDSGQKPKASWCKQKLKAGKSFSQHRVYKHWSTFHGSGEWHEWEPKGEFLWASFCIRASSRKNKSGKERVEAIMKVRTASFRLTGLLSSHSSWTVWMFPLAAEDKTKQQSGNEKQHTVVQRSTWIEFGKKCLLSLTSKRVKHNCAVPFHQKGIMVAVLLYDTTTLIKLKDNYLNSLCQLTYTEKRRHKLCADKADDSDWESLLLTQCSVGLESKRCGNLWA